MKREKNYKLCNFKGADYNKHLNEYPKVLK